MHYLKTFYYVLLDFDIKEHVLGFLSLFSRRMSVIYEAYCQHKGRQLVREAIQEMIDEGLIRDLGNDEYELTEEGIAFKDSIGK